jgi:enoyl-CoA hydratase/carnithine racemase
MVSGACIGGALDLICATDIRICLENAVFSIMEVDLSIPADLGTLQRLPKIIGLFVNINISIFLNCGVTTGSSSFVREVAFTGRKFLGNQSKSNRCLFRKSNEMAKIGKEAHDVGLCHICIDGNVDSLLENSLRIAKQIALKSPVCDLNQKI